MSYSMKRSSRRRGSSVFRALACIGLIFIAGTAVLGIASKAPNRPLVAQTLNSRPADLPLEVHWARHGAVIEVEGKTAAGAAVMINGEKLATILDDGTFSNFMPQQGLLLVTITAQDATGNATTRRFEIPAQ